jgi:hypothetical protein
MCQMSIGHMLLQLPVDPAEFWHDPEIFARGLVELRSRYGFDGILVSLHGHDPEWRKGIGTRDPGPDGDIITWKDGSKTLFYRDDLPRMYPAPGTPLRDPDQIPVPLSYIPVSGGLHFAIHPEHRFDMLRMVRELAGPDISVHGEVTSPFDYLLDSFGYENGLMMLLDDPDRVARLMQRYTEGVVELATEMCREDIDAVKISSPFAGGGFLSRSHYEEMIVPYERPIVEAIQRSGRSAYIHTCGAIGDRLDLMARMGVHGIECLDPPPLGNVELAGALESIGGEMFVKGNIDSVNSMLLGSEEAMVADARERLRVGKRSGKLILSTACSIAPHVSSQRIVRLRHLTDEEGRLD